MDVEIRHCTTWQNSQAKAASLAALIKQRLDVDAVLSSGKTGQFDVIVGGETVASRGGNWLTRSFGAGYPDLDRVVDSLEQRLA